MAEYIKYDFEALDDCGRRLHDLAKATGQIQSTLEALEKNSIEGSWEGKAKAAFIEHSKEIFDRIRKMKYELNASQIKLNNAVERHRANENLQKQNASDLLRGSGDIF